VEKERVVMFKKCQTCKKKKPLGEFLIQDFSARAAAKGTSKHCRECHESGKVKNGYGPNQEELS
jgi:hypothetical protein